MSLLLMLLWLLLPPPSVLSEDHGCTGHPDIAVTSDDKNDMVEICLAADKAISFLATYNLSPRGVRKCDQ